MLLVVRIRNSSGLVTYTKGKLGIGNTKFYVSDFSKLMIRYSFLKNPQITVESAHPRVTGLS